MADPKSTSKFIIYGLYDPNTGELRYIGKTVKGLNKRLLAHISAAHNPQSTSYRTYSACWIRSLGEVRPVANVLECCPSRETLDESERRWIALAKANGQRLANRTDGGDGSLGCSPSQETRLKNRAGRLGKKHTAESRERIRAARLGSKMPPWTQERRQRAAAAQRGKTHTKETRAKISAAKLGKPIKSWIRQPCTEERRHKTSVALAALWATTNNPWAWRSTQEFRRKCRENGKRSALLRSMSPANQLDSDRS